MRIETDDIVLRPWERGDTDALIRHGNNPKIARNLSDRFPEPLDQAAAKVWLDICTEEDPVESRAILYRDEVVGGCVCRPRKGEFRRTLGLGYWVGEAYWGRGIATRVVCALVDHGFRNTDAVRIEAEALGWNAASARVLEKAGFTLEGRLRNKAYKHGALTDLLHYGILREEWAAR
jgi:RimJ/RimL family protein N-acetyltransferase